MHKFTVALLQLIPSADSAENTRKGIRYCQLAKAMGADIALFPEMWNVGYNFYSREHEAVDANDAFVKEFQQLARTLEIAIAVTYLEKWPGLPRNTVSVIDYMGNIVLTYAKVHTCAFDVEQYLTPGEDFYTADLPAKNGPVKIGAMICYDREFPESARILMLKGAEIMLVPNACPIEINRTSQLRTRAFENMAGIAMTNYAAGTSDCNGHSLAFDGIAFGEEGSRDTLLVDAGEAEGIYLAEFDMDALRAYRRTEVWGNAYRKPQKYSLLTVC